MVDSAWWGSKQLRGYLDRLPRAKLLGILVQVLENGKARAVGAGHEWASSIHMALDNLHLGELRLLHYITGWYHRELNTVVDAVTAFMLSGSYCDGVKSIRMRLAQDGIQPLSRGAFAQPMSIPYPHVPPGKSTAGHQMGGNIGFSPVSASAAQPASSHSGTPRPSP